MIRVEDWSVEFNLKLKNQRPIATVTVYSAGYCLLTLLIRSRRMSQKPLIENIGVTDKDFTTLEIDDDAKEIVREIGTAINESVENSSKVAEAIERLRDAGYEMELTLRLEIGLRPHAGDEDEEGGAGTLDLTDEDVQVLQRMKIRIDPEEKL